MCSPVRCQTCGKVTWRGCGDHVEEVRAQVPPEMWCEGHEPARKDEPAPRRGFRIFG